MITDNHLHPRKVNTLPLKMDVWKTNRTFLGPCDFSGVSYGELLNFGGV